MQSVATMNALRPHMQRYENMESLVTDPDRLAAYTVDFFTYVHPVDNNNNIPPQQRYPNLPPEQQSSGGIDLGSIAPEKRWMVADEMERQGMFNGKPLIVGG